MLARVSGVWNVENRERGICKLSGYARMPDSPKKSLFMRNMLENTNHSDAPRFSF